MRFLWLLLLAAGPTSPSPAHLPVVDEGGSARCEAALQASCSADTPGGSTPCAICAGQRQHELRLAGCTNADIAEYCSVVSGAVVTAISPARIPVEGIAEVTVTVTPSAASRIAAAGAGENAVCRLVAYTGPGICRPPDPEFLGQWPAVGLINPNFATTVKARVLNATAIACTPPPVVVEGLAALSVSFDNVTFSKPWSLDPNSITTGCRNQRLGAGAACAGNPCLDFFAAFSAAVGRRPYFDETEGTVMVSTADSMSGVSGLTVSAALQQPAVFLFSRVPIKSGTNAKLLFMLTKLPPTVSTNVTIALHWPGQRDIVKTRRFERAPPPANGRSSAVDHATGALLVDGAPFLMTGMFVSTNAMLGVTHDPTSGLELINRTDPHTVSYSAQLERLARGGINTVMLYDFNTNLRENDAQFLALLDDLAVVGIRVMLMVVGEITPLAFSNTTTAWSAFASLVNRVKGLDNLLGWYICECVGTTACPLPSSAI